MLKLKRIDGTFTICKIQDISSVNFCAAFCFLGKTEEELSLVCLCEDVPEHVVVRDDGWKSFRIEGILDFSMVGVLSKISTVLAEHKIGIFAVSTYNTDYVLTKSENFSKALQVLGEAGYTIE